MAKVNYLAAWKRANPEAVLAASRRYRLKHRERINARQRIARQHDKRRFMLTQKRSRAKREGMAFELTLDNIAWPTHCPVLGMRLNYDTRWPMVDDAPTFDRINPTQGYTAKNTRVVSWRTNRIKANATLAELEALVLWLRKVAE